MSQEIINSILQQSNPQEPVNIDELIKQSDQIQKESEDTDNIFDKKFQIFLQELKEQNLHLYQKLENIKEKVLVLQP
jgi:hypothetical protein